MTGDSAVSPAARVAPQFAYDARDGYAVLFSGQNATGVGLTDTWTYSAGSWTQIFPSISPPARIAGVFVYDPVDQYVVLYGGADPVTSDIFGDTWTFAAGEWTNITPSGGPGPRAEAAATWDSADQSVLVFGGTNGIGPDGQNDTWRFVGGTWTEVIPHSSPSDRVASAMAYDAADGYVVMFGGVNSSSNYSDTWRFLSGVWTQLFPATGPSARALWAMEYDPTLGDVLLFGGGVSDDSLFFGDTWTFHGGGWTQQFPVASPSARSFAPMVWDSGDGYLVMFGGAFDLFSPTAVNYFETWAFTTILTASLGVPSGYFDDGTPITFSAIVTGGVAPYTEIWSFGDGTVGPGPTYTHEYSGPGTFDVTLNVTDRVGGTSSQAQPVSIFARPSVTVDVSPTSVIAGANVTLSASVVGGAPGLSYLWNPGDGSSSSIAGPITVSFGRAGTDHGNLTVTDGAAVAAWTNFTIAVEPLPVAASGPSSTISSWMYLIVGIVVGVAAAALVGLLLRRRNPSPPPPSGASGETAPPARPPG